ncbi:MAG: hypothetical protein IKA12_04815 [Clostridia bacterium]|nr:hypothetical protein [Clostridia bacterium]
MNYHIDTGLIWETFKNSTECPLCEIKKIVEEQFLTEFLNDAVMEDNTRIRVGMVGFCAKHFDMLFSRQNKLSLALQVGTRLEKTQNLTKTITKKGQAKKLAKDILKGTCTCAVCELVEKSMNKYYKTVAQMFIREKEFYKTLIGTKGFCLEHYAKLLENCGCAGFGANSYVEVLSGVEQRNFERIRTELKEFCDMHDYRNAYKPMGNLETALPRTRTKIYGMKID